MEWSAPDGALYAASFDDPLSAALANQRLRTALSLEGLKLLRAYQRLDAEGLADLRLPAAVEREVESAMRAFVGYVLEREARSLAFLDEVRAGV